MIILTALSEKELEMYAFNLRDYIKKNNIITLGILAKKMNTSSATISRIGKEKDNGNYPRKKHTLKLLNKIHSITKTTCIGFDKQKETYLFKAENQSKIEERLRLLATKLAYNLVDVSTPFNYEDTAHKKIIKEEYLNRQKKTRLRERFILITGAGVSHSATKGEMPLATKGIEIIRQQIIKTEKIPKETVDKLIKKELARLRLSTRLDTNEFETQLLAYSKYFPETVKEGLKKMCLIKHLPNLEYEILSHMLKHRFIDVAFNFNFDEIFDSNIKEEISKGDFKYIYSDGQYPDPKDYNDSFLINNRLREPVYIKPHGTISRPNSLRFTREKSAQLSPYVKETLKSIIEAPTEFVREQDYLKINFIIVGFNMKSPLLLEILKEYLSEKKYNIEPYFWFFDKKKDLSEFDLKLDPKELKIIEDNHYCFPINEEKTLADYLQDLWGNVHKVFHNSFQPRGIERHLLINKIFDFDHKEIQKIQNENQDFVKKYLEDRILVELIIILLSSDGIINLSQIMDSRVGKYLHELNLLNKSNQIKIDDLCKKMGLKIYKNFVTDVYVLNEPDLFYSKDLYEYLHKKISTLLSSNKRRSALSLGEFTELAETIKKRNLLKINPQFKHPHRNLFSFIRDENILNTSLKWLYKYRVALENDPWDLLLAISEKGRFISQHETIKKNYQGKQIEVILSAFDEPDFSNISPSTERFKDLTFLSEEPLFLPWWVHNRHMVLFLKRKKHTKNAIRERDKWTIENAFYYENRMLSRKVNPVQITDNNDKEILLSIFANYWHRARIYTKNLKNEEEKSIPIIQNKIELDGYIEDLLFKYKTPKPE